MSVSMLEQRIADALKADDVKSDDLADLIVETEVAAAAADEAVTKTREQALDPLISPDATKARAAMEDAAFTRDRLRTVMPRLQQRQQEVQSQEAARLWRAMVVFHDPSCIVEPGEHRRIKYRSWVEYRLARAIHATALTRGEAAWLYVPDDPVGDTLHKRMCDGFFNSEQG